MKQTNGLFPPVEPVYHRHLPCAGSDVEDSVKVVKLGDGWAVYVLDGGVVTSQSFKFEAYATAWADGQRSRLKLPPFDRRP
jgi:hypothetical protein